MDVNHPKSGLPHLPHPARRPDTSGWQRRNRRHHFSILLSVSVVDGLSCVCTLSLYILDASLMMLSLVDDLHCWRFRSNHSTSALSSTKGLGPLRSGCKVSPTLQRQKMKIADINASLDPR